jgi:hypothetical protein
MKAVKRESFTPWSEASTVAGRIRRQSTLAAIQEEQEEAGGAAMIRTASGPRDG